MFVAVGARGGQNEWESQEGFSCAGRRLIEKIDQTEGAVAPRKHVDLDVLWKIREGPENAMVTFAGFGGGQILFGPNWSSNDPNNEHVEGIWHNLLFADQP